MHFVDFLLIGLAAVIAGVVNALAGGGTLITFPVLLALGLPAVTANVTNTVALCPGYLGATIAQSKDFQGQRHRLWWSISAGVLGGLLGGMLLLKTEERLFSLLVPFLILLASVLLALQEPLRAWLLRRIKDNHAGHTIPEKWVIFPLLLATIYGGYFGAGVSVIVLAVLGLLLTDTLPRLNALKQSISLSTNVAAAIFFLFSGHIIWPVALVMAVGALLGGAIGGSLAGRLKPSLLRWLVVSIGFTVAGVYLVRTFWQ